MQQQKHFEILEGLPTYGPMYIPVSEDGEQFYNEGFVVRFFKSDGTNWVGNFKTGATDFSTAFELTNSDKIVVIAKGQGYIMTPEQTKPIETFGYAISEILQTKDNTFVAADNTDLEIINPDGTIWRSARISWDGIKDLTLQNNIVSGLSFDPMNDADEWIEFSINVDTKEIDGGSYRRYYDDNGNYKKKPFWKLW
jgi:hypothetical protein